MCQTRVKFSCNRLEEHRSLRAATHNSTGCPLRALVLRKLCVSSSKSKNNGHHFGNVEPIRDHFETRHRRPVEGNCPKAGQNIHIRFDRYDRNRSRKQHIRHGFAPVEKITVVDGVEPAGASRSRSAVHRLLASIHCADDVNLSMSTTATAASVERCCRRPDRPDGSVTRPPGRDEADRPVDLIRQLLLSRRYFWQKLKFNFKRA